MKQEDISALMMSFGAIHDIREKSSDEIAKRQLLDVLNRIEKIFDREIQENWYMYTIIDFHETI